MTTNTVAIILQVVLLMSAFPTKARPTENSFHQDRGTQIFAEDYLLKFGYLSDSSSVKTSSLQSIDNAVARFQTFAGLEQTGELDADTIEFMSKKRCGVKDFGTSGVNDVERNNNLAIQTRHKRFALQGSRWKRRNLTYRVTKYPTKKGLSRSDADNYEESYWCLVQSN